ncbi:MAG TPA: hypothetical protein VF590_02475, partial [Isosphaeraceae bacterium]
MEITRVSTHPGGDEQALGPRLIVDPAGTPPRRTFRLGLFVRLTAGTLAEDLVPDAAATVLRGSFVPWDFDALTVAEPSLRASLTGRGGAVIVGLDAPRRVVRVGIRRGMVPAAGYSLEVYRLDGEAIAGAPAATAVNSASRSRAGFVPTVPSSPRMTGRSVPGVAAPLEIGGVGVPEFDLDILDARFALRLKDPDGTPMPLAPGDLTTVRIRSGPSSPRLGLAVSEEPGAPADPGAAVVFWRGPGPTDDAPPSAPDPGSFDVGRILAEELRRGVRRLVDRLRGAAPAGAGPPVLPPALDVALVMESDAPCRVEATALGIAYHLARRSFPEGGPKQVLRFDGRGAATREIRLLLPGSALVRTATLRTVESFRGDRPAEGGDDGVPSGDPGGRDGLLVGDGRSVAQAITLAEALRLGGLVLGLLPLAQGTELRVDVCADDRARPSGRTLSGGSLIPGGVGRGGWASLRLADAVVLPSGTVWVVLTAASGRAVWLTGAGTAPPLVRLASDSPGAWT